MTDAERAASGVCASMRCNFVMLALGLALVAAPWTLGYAQDLAATTSSIVAGVAIWACALMALSGLQRPFEEFGAACGVLAAAAPWFVGFRNVHDAATTHAAIGMAVALVALGGLMWARSRPQPVAARRV